MFSGSRNGSACDCSIVRRANLTHGGWRGIYRHCARIVAEAEAAEQAARALQREPRGMLSMSAPDTFGPMHVAPAITEFLARFPDLAIDISLSPRHVDLVQEGLDLAIRIGTLKDLPLVVRRLAPSRFVLCAAPGYLKTRGVPRAPDDLLRHACFGVSLMPWGDEWHLFSGKDGHKREHRIAAGGVLRSNSADILRTAALSGLGIALLPSWAVGDDLRSGALTRILPGCEPPPSEVYAVYPSNRLMSAKVRAFVDHLARRIGRMPYWDKGL